MAIPAYRHTGTQTWKRPRDEEAALLELYDRGFVARDPVQREHLLTNYYNITEPGPMRYVPGQGAPPAWLTAQEDAVEARRLANEEKEAQIEFRRALSRNYDARTLDPNVSTPAPRIPGESFRRGGVPMVERWARNKLPPQYRQGSYGEPDESLIYPPATPPEPFEIPGTPGRYQRDPKTGMITQIEGTAPKTPTLSKTQSADYSQAIKDASKARQDILQSFQEQMEPNPASIEEYNRAVRILNRYRVAMGETPEPELPPYPMGGEGGAPGQTGSYPSGVPGAIPGATSQGPMMQPQQQQPRRIHNTKTGEVKYVVQRNGQWVDFKTGVPVPIQ